jgi:hypothetical protein
MSSELVVIAPKSIEEARGLAKELSPAHTLPEALRQKPADILAIILTGAELGLAPMQAVRGIQIIKGRPTLAADTMGALVKRRSDVCEYLVLKESTAERAVYEAKRKGDPSPTTMAFTMADAQRARIKSDMYEKYPAQMLRARCLSAICRAVFPDLCLGLYDPEELADVPAPAERDVTPAPSIPRTASGAKAELQREVAARVEKMHAAAGISDAEVVEPAKVAHPMTIKDEAGPSVWERILKLGKDAGHDDRAIGAQVRTLTGKTKPSTLTEEDLKSFARWLDDAPAEATASV